MKLFKNFNLQNIFQQIKETFLRFPFLIVNCVLGTIIGLWFLETTLGKDSDTLNYLLLTLILGAPLLLVTQLLLEKLDWPKFKKLSFQFIPIALMTAYFLSIFIPKIDFSQKEGLYYFLYNVMAYLLISFLPLILKNKNKLVWNFNKNLIIKGLITALYSGVLFLGLFLSLTAIRFLFDIDFEEIRFAQILTVIMGIFSPLYFLNSLPKETTEFETEKLSKVLKVFVHYILIPIICLFTVILYAYLLKSLFTWEWPKHGTAHWIMTFSIANFVVFILGYPWLKENPKLKAFFKIIFISVIPLIILYFLAIGIRIKHYGFTIDRYLVVLYGFWLIFNTFYYLFSKKKKLSYFSLTTVIAIIIFLWGPFNGYAVAFNSQINRFENILEKNQILVNHQLQKAPENISKEEYNEISSIGYYITRNHNNEKFREWLGEDNIKFIKENKSSHYYPEETTKISYYELSSAVNLKNEQYPHNNSLSFYENDKVLPISGYQNLINFETSAKNYQNFEINNNNYQLKLLNKQLIIKKSNQELIKIDLTNKLKEFKLLNNLRNVKLDVRTLEQENSQIKVKIYLQEFYQYDDNNDKDIRLAGFLLIEEK